MEHVNSVIACTCLKDVLGPHETDWHDVHSRAGEHARSPKYHSLVTVMGRLTVSLSAFQRISGAILDPSIPSRCAVKSDCGPGRRKNSFFSGAGAVPPAIVQRNRTYNTDVGGSDPIAKHISKVSMHVHDAMKQIPVIMVSYCGGWYDALADDCPLSIDRSSSGARLA